MNKIYTLSITSLSVLMVFTATSSLANTTFTPIPFQVLNSNESKAKPNVLFVIDNSGSMWAIPESPTTGSYSYMCANRFDYIAQAALYGTTNSSICRQFCEGLTAAQLSSLPATHTCRSSQPRSRMDMVKNVITNIVSDPNIKDSMRWGISYLNYNSWSNINKYRQYSSATSPTTQFISGGPTYFRNQAVDVNVGDNTANAVLASIGTRSYNLNYTPTATSLASWQDFNFNNVGVAPGDGTPYTERFKNIVLANYINGNAIQYRCQKNYVIALSDGEPNGSMNASNLPATFRNTANVNGTNVTYNQWASNFSGPYGLGYLSSQFASTDLKTSGVDNEGGSWNDPKFNEGKQSITTFTVNFGLQNSGSNDIEAYLRNGAQGDGAEYFQANNEAELKNAFNKIFTGIDSSKGLSTTTPAVSSSATSLTYATLNTANWSSQIRLAVLDSNGNPKTDASGNTVYQSVSVPALQPGNNGRRLLLTTKEGRTYFDNESGLSGLIPNIDQLNAVLNIVPIASQKANAWKKTYMPWLIRSSSQTDAAINTLGSATYGLSYRDRLEDAQDASERFMGDILGGSIVNMGPKVAAIGNREKFMVAAANDGMFHFFKAKSQANGADASAASFIPYELKLNYLPGAFEADSNDGVSDTLLKKIRLTMNPSYGKDNDHPHQYLINGGMQYAITDKGRKNGQQIFAVGSLGQGSRGAYAFNVGGQKRSSGDDIALEHDNQNKWMEEVPLWETNNSTVGNAKNGSSDLGYLVGEGPAIARLAKVYNVVDAVTGKQEISIANNVIYASLVPDGMESSAIPRNNYKPSLYVYDVLGQDVARGIDLSSNDMGFNAANIGKLQQVISYTGGSWDNGASRKGLSSPLAVDSNLDGITDMAYAGDMDGNLYRFDFRGTPNQWNAQLLYRGSASQPIIAKPVVYRISNNRLVVMVGTGTDVFNADLDNKTTQSFIAVYDDINDNQRTITNAKTKANLLEQKFETTKNVNGDTLRYSSSHAFDDAQHAGWYINLHAGGALTGERVINQAVIRGFNVYFTSRIYNKSAADTKAVCQSTSASGNSFVNGFNAVSGKAPANDKGNSFFATQIGSDNLYSSFSMSGIASGLAVSNITGLNTSIHGNITNGEFDAIGGGGNKLICDGEQGCGTIKLSQNNICIDGKEWMYVVSSGNQIKKVETGNSCIKLDSRAYKRLSWREIF
ncbi:pilus assembly protein [Vitreoscilla massiliensis]|uniref:Pilus assembly protein n=1 Tax=Vitreoscilla massiliensis TaxID=1689272 RepID=A0ABY4E2D3_9NEIS|nr:PilC/PilY family type IV pilus protein [Vitreoscilla massiliensis]UOO88950.1 pilus assembly protein [Vitreoscilla massiliensis]